ncbi:hypothetical protein LPJ78_001454 [Coemansia sp. RSA 989]|nr:hypothetical protein LPJ68_004005 [Coemansia sp. RSA 1086]KAJ1752175.1 hypothetical protein LPJ79_001471 [Coemansia sp. RSA 1821]KAJ1866917.1 hypothetical protein LPJ78_001454 [Coemansia sp. RSA 989]KAJ1874272.1 hypothetical protein LPJ55_001647 [Coemansia sp. RSA 990]KAJ2631858.1 hypothetical protein H4R22_001692 [Coemansia sp. RSA 1290]KAJ2651133.1 hypothetical protein IWW40_001903 [Coemansia sp. RSA 1250]KAJ2672970.1 hypothetical protein IWW42_002519 [Coemansia sp. RSA 1085]
MQSVQNTGTHYDALMMREQRTTLFFSVREKIGALDECLHALKAANVSMTRIESRPSKSVVPGYDFFVDIDAKSKEVVQKVIEEIKQVGIVRDVRYVSSIEALKSTASSEQVPWFPRKLSDLDTFAEKVLEMGEELSSDHPGAHDPVYRKRRLEIVQKAKAYRTGQPLPRIEYTQEEKDTWKQVYTRLHAMYPKYACREFLHVFPLLEQNCAYGPDEIPQIEDISNFLKDCTGFTLRPVMGLLTPRDFLNSLAFRVFHSTQYIRHHSNPYYTPEPDCCHELLGHVPLFADPNFAELAQEIGLASLGASDEDIEKLATIFWFTAEFGLCREDTHIRAYGAGLLSSFGELEYALSKSPEKRSFDPSMTALQKYPITEYQPVYFVADSFRDATSKLREFNMTMKRPFQVRYNPYTQAVEVLDSKDKIQHFARSISSEMQLLAGALESI